MPTSPVLTPSPYRLAAIDLDGTLLGPDHLISEANARAVEALQTAGAEVVLASGRHYATMHSFGRVLPGVRWMVSVQGAEVSNVDRSIVLHQSFLEPSAARQVLELSRELQFAAFVYTHAGVLTETEAAADAYEQLIGHRPARVAFETLMAEPLFKIVWLGTPERIAALESSAQVAAMPTEKVRSHQRLFEFVQPGMTKASGLTVLSRHLGIQPANAVVFGDAENDLPMFAWAGTSVAMPHGWRKALEQASLVAPAGPPESAFARGVGVLLAAPR